MDSSFHASDCVKSVELTSENKQVEYEQNRSLWCESFLAISTMKPYLVYKNLLVKGFSTVQQILCSFWRVTVRS